MLAGMTASQIAFYATTATIIPVLFLAIAVQGPGYENLLKALSAMTWRAEQTRRWLFTSGIAVITAGAIAALIVFIAAVSEILASYALYQQQTEISTAQMVLTGVILLIFVTAAGPAVTYARWIVK
jgi:hypothetical protein